MGKFNVLIGQLLKRTVENWADLGKVLPDLLHVPRGAFVVLFAALLTALLVFLQRFTGR